MPGIQRQLVDGGIYHHLNRGNGQQKGFHKDGDYVRLPPAESFVPKEHPLRPIRTTVDAALAELDAGC